MLQSECLLILRVVSAVSKVTCIIIAIKLNVVDLGCVATAHARTRHSELTRHVVHTHTQTNKNMYKHVHPCNSKIQSWVQSQYLWCSARAMWCNTVLKLVSEKPGRTCYSHRRNLWHSVKLQSNTKVFSRMPVSN